MTHPEVKGDQLKTVTVCKACGRASCWQGIFYCDDYKDAGTEEKTIEELKETKLEHSDFWITWY